MEPISWYDDLENTLKTAIMEDNSIQAAFLILVGYALHCAIVEWQRMALYFDTLLSPNSINDHESALLSPDKHDRLLFEDESFSRSRKYFWVIDALTRFIQEIEETQDVWERYRIEEVDSALKQLTGSSHDMVAQNLLKAEDEISKLYSVRQRLERHLERTKVLRDGVRGSYLAIPMDRLTVSSSSMPALSSNHVPLQNSVRMFDSSPSSASSTSRSASAL